ncbi:DUF2490 domain-containing protein [Legionella israelensis]|uniref:DUF2490 domain-containing protein n=2 Tax=Legionella israelensis TaxID=454 RepID=A0AAX1EGZ8_9GAMM|nr:DUF2490 domain-containing protein [Legionella israelensis]
MTIMLDHSQQIHLEYHKIFFIFLILLIFFISGISNSAETRLWTFVSVNKKNNDFLYSLRTQTRFKNLSLQYDESVSHGEIGYLVAKHTILSQGLTWSYEKETMGSENILRLWQQLTVGSKYRLYDLYSRTRLEERRHLTFKSWNFKLRERVRVLLPLSDHLDIDGFDEILINLNNPVWVAPGTFDQNRSYIGILGKINQNVDIRVGYLNRYFFSADRTEHVIHLGVDFSY